MGDAVRLCPHLRTEDPNVEGPDPEFGQWPGDNVAASSRELQPSHAQKDLRPMLLGRVPMW